MSTIIDVAREAGVSSATVSRVMSAPHQVAEGTRARVLATMARLGYTPNIAAKTLRTLRTDKVVVAVPDITNPFCAQFIRGVEEAASAAGYAVLLGDTRYDKNREEQYAMMVRRREADGLILLGHGTPTCLREVLDDSGRPLPFINACGFSPDPRIPAVQIDNLHAAAEVIEHLADLGHKRIGIISGPRAAPNSKDRITGVHSVQLERPDLEISAVEGDFSINSGLRRTLELLDSPNPPTAIFCLSDEMAMGALAAFRERGLTCPRDISLAGFDDIAYAQYMNPPLTTVRQPMESMGHEVFRILHDFLTGTPSLVRRVTLAHQLIARESTGPAPKA
ncbi:LacI family DNA-binding transcriptional regulator [Novosphingobium flavum]|uniref:LacI family DNA-binding transcriptional regulator n=1 Tax=Novosphingobium flavum TaxID=1778672 RepID=A0A7X1KMJ8_9SPHN|nr:LacI family DNA-binding transcriptional regulator [Novosphingobium flavum]MBC2666704.1 LacI family DNA-binding transcriptional regulator [Novosphingobium flavum]